MSDLGDRRARKKARTRAEIRSVAQRLFDESGFEAVTIADIARGADVAVQTVFNHFTSKEELFFDGRVPWVEGPAQAVRSRLATECPLTALRGYLVDITYRLLLAHDTADRRRQMATQMASATLQSYERELLFETQSRLAEALAEAWSAGQAATAASGRPSKSVSPALTPTLTAAMWVTTVSTLINEQRHRILAGAGAAEIAAEAAAACDTLLTHLEQSVYGMARGAAAPPVPASNAATPNVAAAHTAAPHRTAVAG